MRSLFYILIILYLGGCASRFTRDDSKEYLDAYSVRMAPVWDSSFVQSPDARSGMILELTLTYPRDQYRIPLEIMDSIRAQYMVMLWRYPLDTLLRKNNPKEPGVFGPYSEYLYEMRGTPLVFSGVRNTWKPHAILPFKADSAAGKFFSAVPPGRYLLWVAPGYFQPEPEVIQDIVIRDGFLSRINIPLSSQRIY